MSLNVPNLILNQSPISGAIFNRWLIINGGDKLIDESAIPQKCEETPNDNQPQNGDEVQQRPGGGSGG